MLTRIYVFILFLLVVLFFGCATTTVISPDLKGKVDSSLSFKEVFQNPNAYKNKMVLWGGEIIQIIPQDGRTLIEILQTPLGLREKPKKSFTSEGKFIILTEEFLDFSFFKKGRKITVVGETQGEILGEKIKSLSGKDYRYPLILSKKIHLWKEYFYPYSSSPQYNPDPHEYKPFERGFRF